MKEKETAAEETVIKLEHICKSYYIGTQEVPVLTDIQLTINKGSFISIMGPSGAGKSTLMKIIVDELSPDSGDVILAKGKTLGYLAQHHQLLLSQHLHLLSDKKVLHNRLLRLYSLHL